MNWVVILLADANRSTRGRGRTDTEVYRTCYTDREARVAQAHFAQIEVIEDGNLLL